MRWLVSRRTPSADPDPPSSTAPFRAVSPEPHSDTESCKSDSPTQTLGRRAGTTQKQCPSPSHSLVLGLPHRAQPSRRDPLLRLQRIANAKHTFQTDNSLSKFRVLLKLFFQTVRKLKLSSGGCEKGHLLCLQIGKHLENHQKTSGPGVKTGRDFRMT